MTDVDHKPGDDALDRATEALRNRTDDELPTQALVQKTLMALREMEQQGGDSHRKIWTMKTFSRLAVAALIAVVIGGMMFWGGGRWGNQLAFGDVIQRMQKIHSLKAKMVLQLDGRQKQDPVNTTVMMTASRMREELLEHVIILDVEKRQMLRLDPKNKTAILTEFVNVPKATMPVNLLDQMQKMTAKDAQELGEERVGDRVMRKFRVAKPDQEMTVWVDPQTQLPTKAEIVMNSNTTQPVSHAVMSDFEWNVDIAESDMSLDPPAGYTVENIKSDASPVSEKDLLEALRALAEMNGGRFAEGMDASAVGKAMMHHMEQARATTVPSKANFMSDPAMKAKMMTWSRGNLFIKPVNGQDWWYAGAGVELGAKDRPVMWYRPAGGTSYRVIFGDLTVKEVAKEQLPKVAATPMSGMVVPIPAGPAAAPALQKMN